MAQRASTAVRAGLLSLPSCQCFCEVLFSSSPWPLQPSSLMASLGQRHAPVGLAKAAGDANTETQPIQVCFSVVGEHHCLVSYSLVRWACRAPSRCSELPADRRRPQVSARSSQDRAWRSGGMPSHLDNRSSLEGHALEWGDKRSGGDTCGLRAPSSLAVRRGVSRPPVGMQARTRGPWIWPC